MSEGTWLTASERWVRALVRLYPADFREELGGGLVEAYRDRCRAALRRGGVPALLGVWLAALADSVRNGLGERLRPARAWRRTGRWGRDAERVLKRLTRAPVFVLTMVGTLTVGLGAFAVVAAVVHHVLLAPLPYQRPDDLYSAWRNYTWVPFAHGALGGPDLADLAKAGGAIEAVVAMQGGTGTLTTEGGGEPREVAVLLTSANLFDVLGVQPALGRGFAPAEAGPGRAPVAVLSHTLWKERFAGDPAILGRQVSLDGEAFTVIGVTGPDFRFQRLATLGPPQGADVYITHAQDMATQKPGSGRFSGLLRARPGTSPQALAAAVDAVARGLDARDWNHRGLRLDVQPVKAELVAPVRPALRVLGLAGLVLVLVLGVNLATLLLVRAAQREREFAIARALGADAFTQVRAMVLEGGVLGLLGGACGALVAAWCTRALVALAPLDLPRRDSIAVDAPVVAVVVGAGLVLGLLAGLVPALWGVRGKLHALLGAASTRGGGAQGRVRRAMVVLQVALSLVLLGTGGLVVRSFERLLRANPGFDPEGVLTLRVPLPDARYREDAAIGPAHERLAQELSALPGVRAVSAASDLPLSAGANQSGVHFPGAKGNTGVEEQDRPLVDYVVARPGYVGVMGIRILAGADFDPVQRGDGLEALIDRALAARFFPGGDAVGAAMKLDGNDYRVVGVMDHARLYDVHQDGRPQVLVRNNTPGLRRSLTWVLKTDRDPLSLVPQVRGAVARVDPQLPLADVQSMEQVVEGALRQQKLSAVLLGGFSLGALVLAAMGLYGVVAGSVARRRYELAVRLALGAQPRSVLRLVLGEGALLVALGLVVGVPGLFLMAKVAGGILVGVSAFDPLTLGAVALGLGGVALLACYVPARQVTGIDPARALRQE